MRCLVTGASGFLGSWLVRQLLDRGHTVTVLMRSQQRSRRIADWLDRVRIVQGSFDDTSSLRETLLSDPIDVIFHLAWSGVTVDFRNQTNQISANVVGTLRLWELARDLGCEHWISLGSQAEYGLYKEMLREDLLARPVSAYGVAKLVCGMMTKKMSQMVGMKHTHVRLLSAYGPGDDPRNMIPSVILTLCAGGVPAMTKGEQIWDYVYVEDAARALCQIAETGATGTLNLASGEGVEIRNVAERIRDLVDPKLAVGLGALPYRPDQVMCLIGDIARLKSATGWRPEVPLQEGLRRTVEWYRTESGKCPQPTTG
jgi:nucleoside-diphosphate-sugar epimerase